MKFKACAVIPVFNHHACLERIVTTLRINQLPCILVDDGSDAITKHAIHQITERDPHIECLTLPKNTGKGAAVITGITRAAERGFTHALQIDADGQHNLDDIPAMCELARKNPQHLISGNPIYDDSVPAVRFYSRYLTHVLIYIDTLSLQLRDSMCGFRVYPIAPTLELNKRLSIGKRMDFDTEIMTRLYWAGTESLFVSTRVRYPPDGTSNFRMVSDNLRMTWLHVRLFLGMLPRIPKLIHHNHTRNRRQHWAQIEERGSLHGLRFIGFVDRVFGRYMSLVILFPVNAYFFLTHPQARRASRQFLIAAGHSGKLFDSFMHFIQFSISILDMVLAWHDPSRIKIDFPERQLLSTAVARGHGVLLLSAHLGNLKLARALSTLIPDLRVNALVYTDNARKVNAMLAETSQEYGLRLIHVQEIGPDTAVMLREKIAAGEVVVTVGDRVPVSEHSPVVEADFLGCPAPFAIGPYMLAHVLECPVYLFMCIRAGRGYRIYLEPFAERIQLPRQQRTEAASMWASRYAQRLAHYASHFPLQWYNFYDFWAKSMTPVNSESNTLDENKLDAQHNNILAGESGSHRWATPNAE